MAFKIYKSGNVTLRLNMTNLESYSKAYKDFFENGGMARTAIHLQKRAWLSMKNKYFMSKSNRIYYNRQYLGRPDSKKLEIRLFGHEPTQSHRISSESYAIKFLPDNYGRLKRDLPHLIWQEEGTKTTVDRQPYLRTRKGLRPITKRKAENLINRGTKRDASGRFATGNVPQNKIIQIIAVEHKALKARGFIKAGLTILKQQGAKIAREFVQIEIARLRGTRNA